jgi:riboflavin kinase/FMN adenylyltransferase
LILNRVKQLNIIERIKRIDRFYGNLGLAIGQFEGHHRGHVEILGSLVNESRKRGLLSAVITFKEHPLKVLAGVEPEKLWTPCEKIHSFKEAGIDLLIYIDFTLDFASTIPQDFIRVLDTVFKPGLYCLGSSFRFGKDNKGDVELLRNLSDKYRFDLIAVDDVIYGDSAVSSTRIRGAVKSGKVDLAGELLGRNYSVHLTGRQGDPFTLEPFISNYALPAEGVFKGKLVCPQTGETSTECLSISRGCFQSESGRKFREGYLYKYYFFSNIDDKPG